MHTNQSKRIEVINDDLLEVVRHKSPAEKIKMIGAANRTGNQHALAEMDAMRVELG